MRNIRLITLALVLVGLVSTSVAQLSYIDASAGLQTPTMEAGDTEFEFADVNADGWLDLVSVGDHGSPYVNTPQHGIMVWFGDGGGAWSVVQTGNFGYGGVALGDVNDDGWLDAGFGVHHNKGSGDFGDQLLEVALGDGTGISWTPWDDGLATNGETWGMFGTDFADVDHDGDLDIGSISFGSGAGIHVYLNNGDGTWTQSFGFLGGNSGNLFEFGDVNGDGHPDFAASHGTGSIWIGDGQGGFTLSDGNLPTPAWRRSTSLGDVDADGNDELAFLNSSGGPRVWKWVSPGTWSDLSGNLPAGGGFDRTELCDMNLDGYADLVAFNAGEPGQLVVYTSDGAGTWTLAADFATPDSCDTAALRVGGDVDHNGYPDIVFVSEENCHWFVGGTNRPRCYVESTTPVTDGIHGVAPMRRTVVAGSATFVDWHSALTSSPPPPVTIHVSRTGPAGPWFEIAASVPNSGRYQWVVPAAWRGSSQCHIAFEFAGVNEVVPEPFTIVGTSPFAVGDLDCDGALNAADIDPFVLALTDAQAYFAAFPGCDFLNADTNADGVINAADIDPFVVLLTGP